MPPAPEPPTPLDLDRFTAGVSAEPPAAAPRPRLRRTVARQARVLTFAVVDASLIVAGATFLWGLRGAGFDPVLHPALYVAVGAAAVGLGAAVVELTGRARTSLWAVATRAAAVVMAVAFTVVVVRVVQFVLEGVHALFCPWLWNC